MERYPLRPDEVARGVPPVPLRLFQDGLETGASSLIRYSQDTLRYQLLPRATATVTDRGIEFKGCVYVFSDTTKRALLVRATNRGRVNVSVIFDPRLCDRILVLDEGRTGQVSEAVLSDRSDFHAGLSFAEVAELAAQARYLAELERNAVENVQHRRRVSLRAVTAAAHSEMREQTGSKSRSARRADTKADRLDERRERRLETPLLPAPALSQTALIAEQPVALPEEETPSLPRQKTSTNFLSDMLRRKSQKEK